MIQKCQANCVGPEDVADPEAKLVRWDQRAEPQPYSHRTRDPEAHLFKHFRRGIFIFFPYLCILYIANSCITLTNPLLPLYDPFRKTPLPPSLCGTTWAVIPPPRIRPADVHKGRPPHRITLAMLSLRAFYSRGVNTSGSFPSLTAK